MSEILRKFDGTPTRSFEELVALYEFEPSVRDVYVEGAIDVGIVRSLLAEFGISNVSIYEICDVEVPSEEVLALGFVQPNRRGEVITLASFLASNISSNSHQASCIVDRDLDDTIGTKHTFHPLLYTDFACMEAYVFDEVSFAKLLRFCKFRDETQYDAIYDSFSQILIERHCYRVANERLGWGLTRLELRKFLEMKAGRVEFDFGEYRTRVMNKNDRAADVARFDEAVNKAKKARGVDCRSCANGHDLIELLEWLFHEVKCIAGKAVSEVVETALYCSMEFRKLGEVGMFKELLARVSSGRFEPVLQPVGAVPP